MTRFRIEVSSFFRILSFVILLAALFPTSAIAVGFQPVSPDELKMTSEPQAPGAQAIILFREVDRDDRGNTAHEDNYVRIKIFTEEGRKYADIEIPYFKGQGNVINVHGRTIKPDGSIVPFDGKVYDKTIVKAKGVKYQAKTFTLSDVQVGGIIEYYYTIDLAENFVFDSHWILSNELFTKNAKFSLHPYTSDVQNINIRWSWHLLPQGATEPKEEPDHVIRMTAVNIPAFETEDYMPPENEMKSRVDFIYSDEPFEKDSDRFWKKIGKKRNGQLESFVGKKKAMEEAVSQIVSPSDAPEVKLQKIYARVQQVMNMSIEAERTEQEQKRAKEKEPENVEDLWKKQSGYGRDITWLYLALVRAAGFEAHGVWVSERRNYFFNAQMMDPYKLDENVVAVKLNGKDAFYDPGSAFVPYGMLPWSETGVRGLELDKDGGTWIQTPLPASADSKIQRKAELHLTDTGGLEGKLTVTYTGLEASERRVTEHLADDTARKKYLEDEVKDFIPVVSEPELTNKPDWNNSSQPLVAEFDLKVPGWVVGAGHRALFPMGLFSAPEKHIFDHTNRVHPIYFAYPYEVSDDLAVDLPLGWQISSVPQSQKQDGHIIVYTITAQNNKGALQIQRELNVDFLMLESKYYEALRSFFQAVRAGDEQQALLQPAAGTAGN